MGVTWVAVELQERVLMVCVCAPVLARVCMCVCVGICEVSQGDIPMHLFGTNPKVFFEMSTFDPSSTPVDVTGLPLSLF
jgi:hypothetical protein